MLVSLFLYISRRLASHLAVRVGSYNLYEEDPGQVDIAVSRVVTHDDYDAWTITNDICLLHLEEEADLSNPNIGTIPLPPADQDIPEGTMCTVSGWGTTSEGGSLARVLMKVEVPVVSDEDCRDAYGQSDITDSMICAGLPEGGKDACQGDSGGPLTCGLYLDGIASWGYGCAEPGFPGVYTQTSYFVEWINGHM